MADNPYSGLLGIMQEQGAKFNPPSICLGEVVSPDPDLKIKTEDLILDIDDFLISDNLIGGHEREIELEEQGTIKSSTQSATCETSHSHNIDSSFNIKGTGKLKFKSGLKAGDIVALIPTANRQQYIVLCKVVSL